jgi:para-nitrobenzyl esterase
LAVFGFGETIAGRALTAAGGRRGLRRVTREVQSHWLNLAKHGAPLPNWPQYKADNRKTLILDVIPRVENDIDRDRRLAWTEFDERAESARVEAAN